MNNKKMEAMDTNQYEIQDIDAHTRAIAKGNQVLIFDTTLRDGEQSPGATLNTQEKLDIAHQLARLGVDIIEAGFPATSPGDLDAVKQVANSVGRESRRGKNNILLAPPVIAGMARANIADIDKVWQAVRGAVRPRIHIVLATSDIHLEHKLNKTRSELLEMARSTVEYARKYCNDVEFSPEDGTRSDPEFLFEVLGSAIQAGATTINIPDTVGYALPEEFGHLIRSLRQNIPGAKNVIFGVHCHNDLGLATANTLAGLENGARHVEVTVNGIGERAGNASLEEITMALHTRRSTLGLDTNIVTQEICRTSHMVSSYTGIVVQPNKAIVGANAFTHESGIHQDGILKHKRTYEIMDAVDIGLSGSQFVLGKHSGRNALKNKLENMGYRVNKDHLNKVFRQFKELSDHQKFISDSQVEALYLEVSQTNETLEFAELQC